MQSERDRIFDLLNEEWRAGRLPPLKAFISVELESNAELLADILDSDLQYRTEGGETVHVESYLESFPQLHQAASVVLQLLVSEYIYRSRQGVPVDVADFCMRFPLLAEKFQSEVQLRAAEAVPDSRFVCRTCASVYSRQPNDPITYTCSTCDEQRTTSGSLGKKENVLIGTTFGKFEVIEIAGKGGFGTVYKARDTTLDRLVALKVPNHRLTTGDEQSRFQREAVSGAKLQHIGVIPVYEAGVLGDIPYIASEYVFGDNLKDILEARKRNNTPVDSNESATIMLAIAEAMAFAHDQGIVHRDLKPANVMLTKDAKPRVMDFGLAKLLTDDMAMTQSSHMLGSPAYMSPELANGGASTVDARSDVFSLGVILYELITGVLPFKGTTPFDLIRQIGSESFEPEKPSEINSQVPTDLETICLAAIMKPINDRYQSAAELADDLRCFLVGTSIKRCPPNLRERAWRWCRRNRAAAAYLTAIATSLVAGTVVSLTFAANAATQRHRADTKANEALESASKAIASNLLAEERRAIAVDSLNVLITDVSYAVEQVPELHAVGKHLLTSAITQLEKVKQDGASRNDVEKLIIKAILAVGDGQRSVGSTEAAGELYGTAEMKLLALINENPADIALQASLAESYLSIALLDSELENYERAESYYVKAFETYNAIKHLDPKHEGINIRQADVHLNQSRYLFVREMFDDAQEHAKIALSLLDEDPKEQSVSMRIDLLELQGTVSFITGHFEDAVAKLEQCQSLCRAKLGERPSRVSIAIKLAKVNSIYAKVKINQGVSWALVRVEFEKSLELVEPLLEANPYNGELWNVVIDIYRALAEYTWDKGDHTQAMEFSEKCRTACLNLTLAQPQSHEAIKYATRNLIAIGDLYRKHDEHAKAITIYNDSLRSAGKLVGLDLFFKRKASDGNNLLTNAYWCLLIEGQAEVSEYAKPLLPTIADAAANEYQAHPDSERALACAATAWGELGIISSENEEYTTAFHQLKRACSYHEQHTVQFGILPSASKVFTVFGRLLDGQRVPGIPDADVDEMRLYVSQSLRRQENLRKLALAQSSDLKTVLSEAVQDIPELLSLRGDRSDLEAAAATLQMRDPGDPENSFAAARCFAIAAGVMAAEKPGLAKSPTELEADASAEGIFGDPGGLGSVAPLTVDDRRAYDAYKENALRNLEKAIAAGLTNTNRIATLVEFEVLRPMPAFQKMIPNPE